MRSRPVVSRSLAIAPAAVPVTDAASAAGSGGDDACGAERGGQLLAETHGVGRLGPAAQTDVGRHHDVVGGYAMSARVPASSAVSSWFGTMLTAGAYGITAPGRARAAPSSPERRSAVTSTTQPAMTWSMGSLTAPV